MPQVPQHTNTFKSTKNRKMAKAIILVIASALCVLALAHAHAPVPAKAHSHSHVPAHDETFTIEGKVYCDTCRVMFPTKLSEYLKDAKVELSCKDQENGTVTYRVPGITGEDGSYNLTVVGDHADEICDVVVVSSPDPDCDEIVPEIDSSRLCLTDNSGIQSQERYANPIGFMAKKALDKCNEVLDELGFIPLAADGGPVDGPVDGPVEEGF